MRIFVSYASEDTQTAEEVQYALQQEGHSAFIGSGGLTPASGYHQRLRDEVEASDVFIFLISAHSVTPGRYTLTELGTQSPSGPGLPNRCCRSFSSRLR